MQVAIANPQARKSGGADVALPAFALVRFVKGKSLINVSIVWVQHMYRVSAALDVKDMVHIRLAGQNSLAVSKEHWLWEMEEEKGGSMLLTGRPSSSVETGLHNRYTRAK